MMLHTANLPAEATTTTTADRAAARTSFQSADPYSPSVDIRTDVAIAYGVDDTLTSRIAEWKRQGYRTELMTGAAWGGYEAYIDGRFDGKNHADEGQVGPDGQVIWHHPGVPYMVPTPSFVKYLCSLVEQAIDAGAEGLHLEEPEFWSRAGYSEGFKRLWQAEYSEPWQRPDSSPDAYWRSSKLKYILYKRTLEQVFAHAKEYAARKGRDLPCYVPTHSIVSYAQWGIVSPESSLMDLPNCDGYIAQVWTGTARSPNRYHGVFKERTFETAFLEYASMNAMTAPTGRRVYFLADPVEDDPAHTWDDYRSNYEKVLVASLMFRVSNYEVMPWPNRVFTHKYPAGAYAPDDPTTRILIPPSYASELMLVSNALLEMDQPHHEWNTDAQDVAVLMSDTMMFQRHSPWSTDSAFDELFGLSLPLLKNGIPVRSVILERIADPLALSGVTVIVMSYDHMKPLTAAANEKLAAWVQEGGALVYRGGDDDAFHQVREWWNADGTTSETARTDLFKRLGVVRDAADGTYPAGKGKLVYRGVPSVQLAHKREIAESLLADVLSARPTAAVPARLSNYLGLRRGPFYCGAVLDETATTTQASLRGTYLNLFSHDAELVSDPNFSPGQAYLLRIIEKEYPQPQILATTARCEATTVTTAYSEFNLRGPIGIPGVVRVGCPRDVTVTINGKNVEPEWDQAGSTFRLKFEHDSNGTLLRVAKR